MQKRYLLILFILSVILPSCEFKDRSEAIVPGYIYIPSYISETPNDGSKGAAIHNFPDVWVYVDGRSLGNYGLPALIPVPKTGNVSITIDAGITRTGQDMERLVYPMILTYEQKLTLTPNQIDTIVPVFRYRNNTVFPMIEDFDRIGFRFSLNPLYTQVGDTVVPFKGKDARDTIGYSGRVVSATGTRVFQMYTTENYLLPGFNQPVYFEMDYNTDVPLIVGYYFVEPNQTGSAPNEIIRLFPTGGQWRKIYVAMNREIASNPMGSRYRMYVGFFKNPDQVANVLIDNLKLVHLD
jgi:hypothetical protein